MSENEEYMPLIQESTSVKCCITCKKKMGDGVPAQNNRCHNCYWRLQNSTTKREKDRVPLICDGCGDGIDWKSIVGNYCNVCNE
jgi:hypothetical protein|uniref:Uncharacterized protein n=1 Tax=viral metagenome TaxID=1070528 RepID=A0A6C0IJD1_9ZZZZ